MVGATGFKLAACYLGEQKNVNSSQKSQNKEH